MSRAETTAELMADLDLVHAFWAALRDDDDAAAERLFYPMSRLKNGMTTEGLAEQLRERMDVTVDQCASMGVSNRARLMRDGMWAFGGEDITRSLVYPQVPVGLQLMPLAPAATLSARRDHRSAPCRQVATVGDVLGHHREALARQGEGGHTATAGWFAMPLQSAIGVPT